MAFEEKAEKWIAEKFADFPYQQTALHSIEWARQETLREVIPVLKDFAEYIKAEHQYGPETKIHLDAVDVLLKKLEAESEG